MLDRLRTIKHVLAVMSGKGGVGKSYVTAGLAQALAERGSRVGVLDADLSSPTVARMLDARGPLRVDVDGVHPARAGGGRRQAGGGRDHTGIPSYEVPNQVADSPLSPPASRLPPPASLSVFSTDLLLADGAPLQWKEPDSERFIWRGLLETGALREFLSDVAWGDLDILLIDLPPGTDKLGDLAELVPNLSGAIAVTIPSEESRRSVERAMRSALASGVTLIGVIENMSGYECGGCGKLDHLFEGDAGAELAAEFGVPLLARIPFRPSEFFQPPKLPADMLHAILPSALTQPSLPE